MSVQTDPSEHGMVLSAAFKTLDHIRLEFFEYSSELSEGLQVECSVNWYDFERDIEHLQTVETMQISFDIWTPDCHQIQSHTFETGQLVQRLVGASGVDAPVSDSYQDTQSAIPELLIIELPVDSAFVMQFCMRTDFDQSAFDNYRDPVSIQNRR